MAIDTRAKRQSMLTFSVEEYLSTPTGTVDAAARATFLLLYEGVALGAPVPFTPGTTHTGVYLFASDWPLADAEAVTTDVDFAQPCKGLYIGSAGDLNVIVRSGDTVLFTNCPAGLVLPVHATRVVSASTTATDIFALR